MFTGIEHFAIASPNPKRLADWYVGNLEFKITFEYAGNYFVEAKNGALIEIIPAEGEAAAARATDIPARQCLFQRAGADFGAG